MTGDPYMIESCVLFVDEVNIVVGEYVIRLAINPLTLTQS